MKNKIVIETPFENNYNVDLLYQHYSQIKKNEELLINSYNMNAYYECLVFHDTLLYVTKLTKNMKYRLGIYFNKNVFLLVWFDNMTHKYIISTKYSLENDELLGEAQKYLKIIQQMFDSLVAKGLFQEQPTKFLVLSNNKEQNLESLYGRAFVLMGRKLIMEDILNITDKDGESKSGTTRGKI
jgi:hypothetical protein